MIVVLLIVMTPVLLGLMLFATEFLDRRAERLTAEVKARTASDAATA